MPDTLQVAIGKLHLELAKLSEALANSTKPEVKTAMESQTAFIALVSTRTALLSADVAQGKKRLGIGPDGAWVTGSLTQAATDLRSIQAGAGLPADKSARILAAADDLDATKQEVTEATLGLSGTMPDGA